MSNDLLNKECMSKIIMMKQVQHEKIKYYIYKGIYIYIYYPIYR